VWLNSGLPSLGTEAARAAAAMAGTLQDGCGGEFRPFQSPYPESRVGLELPGLPVSHFCSRNLEVLRCHILE